VLARE